MRHHASRVGGLRSLSDADLVAGIAGWSRASTVAEARKLAAIAETKRRATERAVYPMGACDDTDAAAAELACALTVSHGRALGLMDTATTLRDRLPRLGARFLAGEVSAAVVSRIVWHTGFVRNAGVWAALDAELSERAAAWGVLSADKLEKAIEVWIDKYDPDAVRQLRSRVRGRSFTIGKRDDHTGTTAVYGSLSVADAAVLSERFAVMLAGLCEDDPRTMAQRRADAVGALGAGSFVLACRCDNPDCGARSVDDGRASSVVVHVFGEHASMDAPLDTELHGEEPPSPTSSVTPGAKPTTEPDTAHKPETDQKSQPASKRRIAGLIPGMRGAIVPAPLLADLIAHGAEVRFVGGPEDVKGVDGYRPSAAMDRFVRARDLTCRMPGCDRPAMHADIDHTVPYPYGPTHPSNTKCYCRIHYRLSVVRLKHGCRGVPPNQQRPVRAGARRRTSTRGLRGVVHDQGMDARRVRRQRRERVVGQEAARLSADARRHPRRPDRGGGGLGSGPAAPAAHRAGGVHGPRRRAPDGAGHRVRRRRPVNRAGPPHRTA